MHFGAFFGVLSPPVLQSRYINIYSTCYIKPGIWVYGLKYKPLPQSYFKGGFLKLTWGAENGPFKVRPSREMEMSFYPEVVLAFPLLSHNRSTPIID